MNCEAGLRGQAIRRGGLGDPKGALRGGRGHASIDIQSMVEQDSMDRREFELTNVWLQRLQSSP